MIANKYKPKIEGFSQEKIYYENNENLFDDFYCSIYDDLVLDPVKNKYEIDELKQITKLNKNINVLDVGMEVVIMLKQ